MLKKNDIIELEITGMTTEGNGVGRHDGIAIFVPLTAVGDIARIRIVKMQKSFGYGILEELISPSKERIKFDCPVFSKCGGCSFRHISYPSELAIKDGFVKDAFKRIGKLDIPFEPISGCENSDYYRNKAQYPVAEMNGQAVCGFFSKRSHRIIPFTACKLQPVEFEKIVGTIIDFVNANKIPAYNEENNTGILRHIYIRKGFHSGEIMVCLVVRKLQPKKFRPLAEILSKQFPDIKSVQLNLNPKNTNVILGKENTVLLGTETITDVMCGNKIKLSPLSFYQVNTPQAELLYGIAEQYAELSSEDTLMDLYCGAGTIGLSMAGKVGKLTGVEIVPEAIENAKENAAANGITNAEFICGDAGQVAEQFARENRRPDVIIVDPPRKGCDESTLNAMADMSPKRIVMISCNPATAARDCAYLETKGYKAVKGRAVDLFPRTTHVECVILLKRNK